MELFISLALTTVGIFLVMAVVFEDRLDRKVNLLIFAVLLLTLSDIAWRAMRYAF